MAPRASRRNQPDARPIARRVSTLLAIAMIAASWLLPLGGHIVAAGAPPTMSARVLLQGHARLGSWIAIQVHLHNEGPSVSGELRLQGGSQGGTRYAAPVQLDSPSDKDWTLYAQAPSFGQQLEVDLASGSGIIASQKVSVTLHDSTQLIVGVVADDPGPITGALNLPAVQNQQPAVVVPLAVADLPNRLEAWSAMDRLVWQDVDASTLSSEQMTALRGWLALGGRLVIVGGTGGIGTLGGFPDDLLPYRPTSTIDVAPDSLRPLVGGIPNGARDVPAMSGDVTRGSVLATAGGRAVAAQADYGSGSVTVLGIDPTVGWVADSGAARTIWSALIPPRTQGTVAMGDDTQIVNAVGNLPALDLPPLAGLLLLLVGYVALIGPLNYLVLRRIDRREWAWVTMPVLIVGFAVGAYAFGSALRGSSIIVNQVAIVRGAPDAAEGTAQVYLGVFSPARGTYQVSVPGGALLSSPISGDIFNGQGASLDVLQGDPSRVRDLAVGFGSLRTIRAESEVVVPKIHAELALQDGTLTGTIRNDGDTTLETPAIVLGQNVKVFKDLAPGEQVAVSLPIAANAVGQLLSDRIFGPVFFDGSVSSNDQIRRNQTRHMIIDQLTTDPQTGNQGRLASDQPVILAWGRKAVLDVSVQGQGTSQVSNVLYDVPVPMAIRGHVVFAGDLLTTTIVQTDAGFFNKDPSTFSFGRGSATVSYRPLPFSGSFDVSHVRFALNLGGDIGSGVTSGVPVAPIDDRCLDPKVTPGTLDCPKPVPGNQPDGLPEVEVFDRMAGGAWHRLPHPAQGASYDLADPARYVDPATGSLLMRFVNDGQDGVGFAPNVAIEGTIR